MAEPTPGNPRQAGMVFIMVTTVCVVGYLACRQSLKVSVRTLMTT